MEISAPSIKVLLYVLMYSLYSRTLVYSLTPVYESHLSYIKSPLLTTPSHHHHLFVGPSSPESLIK